MKNLVNHLYRRQRFAKISGDNDRQGHWRRFMVFLRIKTEKAVSLPDKEEKYE